MNNSKMLQEVYDKIKKKKNELTDEIANLTVSAIENNENNEEKINELIAKLSFLTNSEKAIMNNENEKAIEKNENENPTINNNQNQISLPVLPVYDPAKEISAPDFIKVLERKLTAHGIDKSRWSNILIAQAADSVANFLEETGKCSNWDEIKEIFLKKYESNGKLFIKQQELFSFKFTGMRDFLSELEKFIKLLQETRKIGDTTFTDLLIAKLPWQLKQDMNLLKMAKNFDTFEEFNECLLECYYSRKRDNHFENNNWSARLGSEQPKVCNHCQYKGHTEEQCDLKKRKVPRCSSCNRFGHTVDNCRNKNNSSWYDVSQNIKSSLGNQEKNIKKLLVIGTEKVNENLNDNEDTTEVTQNIYSSGTDHTPASFRFAMMRVCWNFAIQWIQNLFR